jgi:stress response protein SCP2
MEQEGIAVPSDEDLPRAEEKEAISPNEEEKVEEETEVWQLVGRKVAPSSKLKLDSKIPSTPKVSPQPQAPCQSNLFSNLEDTGVLVKSVCSVCKLKLKADSFSRTQLHKGVDRKCLSCLKARQPQPKPSPAPQLSGKPLKLIPGASPSMIVLPTKGKSAAKLLLKKQLGSQSKKNEHAKGMPQTSTPQTAHHEELETARKGSDLLESPTDSSEECAAIGWRSVWLSSAETFLQANANMSVFRLLNRDTSAILLSFLQPNDVLALGSCCRGTASLCDDWLVWRELFGRTYPRSALAPIGPNSSWKTAFMLERNGLAQTLTCFCSFSTHADSVLGFPISFTTNPKTGCLDYVTSTFDILSFESFKEGNVRKTVWGERFTDFLPIYIDEDHFSRGLPQLLRVSRKIVQAGAGLVGRPKDNNNRSAHQATSSSSSRESTSCWVPRNEPEMVLLLLTKMMNTQVVLLCDKGIAASEVALMGYCQLHRLLLAVVDRFPQLRLLIRSRLDNFARNPESRVKACTPSLGELLALLSVSDTYSWQQLSLAYIKESFDRSVLWACSKDPSLAVVTSGDDSRLSKYLITQRVSLRLTLFHAVFLDLLVQGGGSQLKLDDCADRYDTFQGRPPLCLRREWQKRVGEILNFDSWPQFFSISGIPLPSKSFLLSTLEQAVGNSLRKGYHSKTTVFRNVMRSGVSRILLKGETYSAAPNLKKIRLVESWRFDGEPIYLDASCLCYGFDGEHLFTVDYENQRCYSVAEGRSPILSIQHSGDVIDEATGTGRHTLEIDLPHIADDLATLFFTVSAWTTTLAEVHQPAAHLHDVVSDTEMCRYKLEEQDTGDKTAVIMCKLHRPSCHGRWQLTSIGHVGYGRAGNYSPLAKDIRRYL